MVSYSTWMVSYSTTDSELQHTGWVKINAGTAAERCRNICGQQNYYWQYQWTQFYIFGSFYFSVKPPFNVGIGVFTSQERENDDIHMIAFFTV
jgi:hypothetical protein